jgi:type IV pilus assembly protein PilC
LIFDTAKQYCFTVVDFWIEKDMTRFDYIASDDKGRETKGSLDADNTVNAINILRGKGLYPTSVVESTERKISISGIGLPREGKKESFLSNFFRRKVRQKSLMIFARQLAVLIDAGLPILKSLHVLKEQEKSKALKEVIVNLADAVEGGSTFSEALSRHPKVFSKLFINMVRAGEAGGVLDEVLNRLAEFMEKSHRLKARIKSAMVYPTLVLFFALGIVSFLVTVVVPKFSEIFLDMEIDLPAMTSMLIQVSDFSKQRWYLFVLGFALLVVLFKWAYRSQKGKFTLDKFILKMPIFGDLILKVTIARLTRTLGTLISSGVPILKALTIVRETIGNEVIVRAITLIHDSIREGESIVGPLRQSQVFPPMVAGMVDVGEQTGNLAEMLIKIADTYEEEVEVAVQGLTSVIEPVLIVTLAVIVGFIVIAMFLPLIKLMQGIA